MISSVLKEYKSIYNSFYEVGKSYSVKDILEQDKNNYFDKKLWNHFSKHGLHGLLVDTKFGGKKFSVLKTTVAYEALANGCVNNGLIFSSIAHLVACVSPFAQHGSASQKEKLLAKMASGKLIAANAITEEEAGSDVYNMNTTAVKKGNNYILNGEKIYITNAPISNVILVYALTDQSKGFFGGVSCFIVKSNSAGIKITKPKNKMGLRTAQMGFIQFNNVKVEESAMLGKPGGGGAIFNQSMVLEKVVMSGFLVGQLQRLLDQTIAFTKQRKVSGKRLIEHPTIQHKLADIKTNLTASRNMVYDAAHAIDSNNKSALVKASEAKLFVSEHVVNAIKDLQELYGAYGYLSETGIEREYRDSYAALIYSGTSAIQRNIIGGSL